MQSTVLIRMWSASPHQPRFKPVFSGRLNSYCTEALAPPSPAATSCVAASWKARRSSTGACSRYPFGSGEAENTEHVCCFLMLGCGLMRCSIKKGPRSSSTGACVRTHACSVRRMGIEHKAFCKLADHSMDAWPCYKHITLPLSAAFLKACMTATLTSPCNACGPLSCALALHQLRVLAIKLRPAI